MKKKKSELDKIINQLDPEQDPLPKFDRRKKYNLNEIITEFEIKGFEQPSELMASDHDSTAQFIRQRKGVKDRQQDHWRVFEKNTRFEIESHIDRVSPDMKKNPVLGIPGHVIVDVGIVTAGRSFDKNLNETNTFNLKKKVTK